MIDVVVVAYRSVAVIERCLAAARTIPGLGQIVVIDHGDDGTSVRARDLGAAVIADPHNPGFGAGQNRGIAATTAPYVLLLNPDAEVDGPAVARGAELLATRPEAGLVQGIVASADGGEPERSRGREIGPIHLWGRALGLRRLLRFRVVRAMARRLPSVSDHVDRTPVAVEEVEWLAATVVLARRAAIEAVNGFDGRNYFLYGEDLDLCRRLRANGWALLAVPDRWALHLSGASSASSWAREVEWWRGTMTFAGRSWGGSRFAVAEGAAFVRWLRLAAQHPSGAPAAWRALLGSGLRARRSMRSDPGCGVRSDGRLVETSNSSSPTHVTRRQPGRGPTGSVPSMNSDEGTPRPPIQPVAGQPEGKLALFEQFVKKTAKVLRRSR